MTAGSRCTKLRLIMGLPYTDLTLTNLFNRQQITISALVDTGATFMCVTEEMATQLGADVVISMREDLFRRIAKLTNGKLYYPRIGKPSIEGGVSIVYDCVSSSDTINNSLRFLKGKGRLVIVATAGSRDKIDFAPVWFRELRIIGTCEQGFSKYKGKMRSEYEIAVELIKGKKVDLKKFVTHKFPISEFKKGLRAAINKKEPTIKVMLYND